MKSNVIVLLLVIFVGMSTTFSKEKIKAFIVHSYESNNVCGVPQGDGIIGPLKKKFGNNIIFETHFMNTKTVNSSKEKMKKDAQVVLQKINKYRPDVVFTIDDNAFREVGLKLHNRSFPVIFTGMNGQPKKYNKTKKFLDKKGNPIANITGVYEKLHVQTSLRVVRQIIPSLKKIIFLLDKTPTGNAIDIQLRRELKNNKTGIEYEIKHVGTMKKYTQEIKRINKDKSIGAVYNVVLSIKTTGGKSVGARQTFKEFIKISKKPAIPLNFAFCKLGLFGGASLDFSAMGKAASDMAIKLLNGGSIKSLPIVEPEKYLLAFNIARAKMLGIVIPDDILGASVLYDKIIVLEQ